MNPPDWNRCTEQALWEYVGYHLAAAGIESVLVGGAVVAIYSHGAYRSGDIDMLIDSHHRRQAVEVLSELGFLETGRHFRHPECAHLFIEFPPGPLAIGSDYRIRPASREVAGQTLLLFSPSDCVCDRLASWIHFESRDALDQALLVAAQAPVDLERIHQWCRLEGQEKAHNEFLGILRSRKNAKSGINH